MTPQSFPLAFCILATAQIGIGAEITVPGFTAYLEPVAETRGARVSERRGVAAWTDPDANVVWFGRLTNTGPLRCAVDLKLLQEQETRLRLSVAGQSRETSVRGRGTNSVRAAFGTVEVASPGYQRFTLESLNPAGQDAGTIEALIVDGAAAKDAHFNLKPRRNAASVHLFYPTEGLTNSEAFYCEVTAVDDPVHTFYMACGWHRGYLGMQVNGPEERRIIFSVWDSGNEAVDRAKVGVEDRVQLVAKGEEVYAGDFGNEGTGGHSHLKYQWKTGETQRFAVTARPASSSHTIFSGYYFHPDRKEWFLISSWKAPKEGGYLRGLHSFSENFAGSNGHLRRKALFGNQWLRLAGGKWQELTQCSFSHDSTGRLDRLDRFMGVESGCFFLSHGGYVEGFTRFGERFERPASRKVPADLLSAGW